jgi:hypothetical protein
MFSYYWYSPYGYNPFAPYRGTSNAYPYAVNASVGASGGNCYNSTVPMAPIGVSSSCPTNEEILNYITNLEVNRKLGDLSNVKLDRSPEPNDVLVYDHLTGFWVLTNYISGGSF